MHLINSHKLLFVFFPTYNIFDSARAQVLYDNGKKYKMFIALLLTTLLFLLLDMFWFSWSLDRIYRPTFLAIQGAPLELRLAGGIVAWFLLAVGIRYFAVMSGGDGAVPRSGRDLFTRGAILGAIVYGVYNGTNYATLSNYPVSTAVADTLWGTFAVGAVSAISGPYF